MKTFDFNRFCKTLRWVLSVNRRKLLMWTVGTAVGVFIGEMAIKNLQDNYDPRSLIWNYAQLWTALLVIVTLFFLSSVTAMVKGKRQREAFLMLPASNLEKFLSLAVYSTVICTLCVFLGVVVGDTLRMGWYWVADSSKGMDCVMMLETGETWYWWSSAIPQMLGTLTPNHTWPAELCFSLLLLVWIHSLYTLCGTWLRKYAFVVASLVLIAIPLLIAYFFVKEGEHLNLFVNYNDVRSVNPLVYVLDVLFVVFSVLNYWASFRIFKNFQLITNKWLNYDFH